MTWYTLSPVCNHTTCECTYVLMTQLVMAIWEYLITLASEVDLLWRKPVTAPSILFVAIRWIMLVNALVQFAPVTEATFDSTPLLHVSGIDTFPSDCDALVWATEVLSLAGFIETACKQDYFTATSIFCALNGT